MRYGITVLAKPSSGDFPALTPADAGTRFSDPGEMQVWVDLGGGYIPSSLHTKNGHLCQTNPGNVTAGNRTCDRRESNILTTRPLSHLKTISMVHKNRKRYISVKKRYITIRYIFIVLFIFCLLLTYPLSTWTLKCAVLLLGWRRLGSSCNPGVDQAVEWRRPGRRRQGRGNGSSAVHEGSKPACCNELTSDDSCSAASSVRRDAGPRGCSLRSRCSS